MGQTSTPSVQNAHQATCIRIFFPSGSRSSRAHVEPHPRASGAPVGRRVGCAYHGGEETATTLDVLVKEKRERILRLCAKHGARSVRVFGSVARGQADQQSDVDFLVELEPGRTLLDLGGLQQELEILLGCRVDVVTVRGLKSRIRDRVLREAIPV